MSIGLNINTGLTFDGELPLAALSAAREATLRHVVRTEWTTEATASPDRVGPVDVGLGVVRSVRESGGFEALYLGDSAVAWLALRRGGALIEVRADSPEHGQRVVGWFREALPDSAAEDADVVPVCFWADGRNGTIMHRRHLDAPTWDSITANYVEATRGELDALMDPDWRPYGAGQLILWAGPPGTGKTTALRALAQSWRDWCDLHYIVDPDKFFGSEAGYMIEVMLSESGAGVLVAPGDPEENLRWKLLVLEDSGELLAADARAQTGQALSRFLNVVDGLIGQGLRLMVLVTTNEELGRLHEAVTRPGRCAARVEFAPFSTAQAIAWMQDRDADGLPVHGGTLADLYARIHGREVSPSRGMGF